MTGFVRERVDVGENIVLVIHQDVGRRAVAAGRKSAAPFVLSFRSDRTSVRANLRLTNRRIPRPAAASAASTVSIASSKEMSRLNFGHERDIGVVVMQFVEPEHAPAQIVVAKERRRDCCGPRRSGRRKPRSGRRRERARPRAPRNNFARAHERHPPSPSRRATRRA